MRRLSYITRTEPRATARLYWCAGSMESFSQHQGQEDPSTGTAVNLIPRALAKGAKPGG